MIKLGLDIGDDDEGADTAGPSTAAHDFKVEGAEDDASRMEEVD